MGACCAKPQTNEGIGTTPTANHLDPVIKAPPPPALTMLPGDSAQKSSRHDERSVATLVPATPSPTTVTPATTAIDPAARSPPSTSVRRLSAPVLMPPDAPDDAAGWTSMASGECHVMDKSAESTPRMASAGSGAGSPHSGKSKRTSNLNPDAGTTSLASKELAADTPAASGVDSDGALAATEAALTEGKRSLEICESSDPNKSMRPSLGSIAEPSVELEAIDVTLPNATPKLARAESGPRAPELAEAAEAAAFLKELTPEHAAHVREEAASPSSTPSTAGIADRISAQLKADAAAREPLNAFVDPFERKLPDDSTVAQQGVGEARPRSIPEPVAAGNRITGTWYAMADSTTLESQMSKPIAVYITSMRAVRKTYEQCVTVRGIFEKYGCLLDVRDISMSVEFREELKRRLGGTSAPVPRVFVGDKYLGGFDEVLNLNETEQLKKMLQKGGYLKQQIATHVCTTCGNMKFVPCQLCNGSRKIHDDDGETFRCPDCNENGLVKCHVCYT